MPRISGTNIPENKRIVIALRYVFGIGKTLANQILQQSQVDNNTRAKDLTVAEISRIQSIIDKNYTVEGALKRDITENIKRLKEIGTWRGSRHIKRLPIHGRTRVNSRTVRGNSRKTMGSGRIAPARHT